MLRQRLTDVIDRRRRRVKNVHELMHLSAYVTCLLDAPPAISAVLLDASHKLRRGVLKRVDACFYYVDRSPKREGQR